jgi:uncharacterized membrane protein YsdA (DUF1294 family)
MITCERAFYLYLSYSSGREYNLISFQIYGNDGRHTESSTVRTIPDLLFNDVLRRSLHCDGKYFILIYKIFNYVYFYVFSVDMLNILTLACSSSGNSKTFHSHF